MKNLIDYLTETKKGRIKIERSEYQTFFNVSSNYHEPILVGLAYEDWGDNVPKIQPKGSIVIGTGKLKGKAILTNDGEDNLYDEIIKLAGCHPDLELYVQMKYHGTEEFAYPIYKVDDEGDSAVMISVAPNAKIDTVEF